MKNFILLIQLSSADAAIAKLMNPPQPGCGCVVCDALAKPDAPFIASLFCPTATYAKVKIEEYKQASDFVAAVSLENDTCFVYKANGAITMDTDLMIISLGSYQLASRVFANRSANSFANIIDARKPAN